MDAQDGTQVEQPTPVNVDPPEVVDAAPVVEGVQEPEKQVEEAQTEDQQHERDEKGRFKGVQVRIDELTRQKHEASREAAYWRQVAQQGQAQTSAKAATATEPTPDQFDDYGHYVKALAKWEAKQIVAETLQERAQQQQAQTRTQTFEQRMGEARKAIADFDEVVGSSNAPIASHVAEAMQESEHGPALAYHFAKNPDALLRLNSLDVRTADREIGRLESMFADKPATPVQPTKKVTQAPQPANVSSTQGRATSPTLANSSMEEYMAQRKNQGARWAR